MNKYDPGKNWSKYLSTKEMSFPSEYVIRIFKGSYPRLNLDKNSFMGKKICDVGCGDGRNLVLLHQCGFKTYGTEIKEEIVNKTKLNLKKLGILSEIRIGTTEDIAFENNFFDYLLSWNSCYYMGKNMDFSKHVREFSRILKKNGYLIMSIPKKSCFIYHGSRKIADGYRIIRNDPFGVRNGEIFRIFNDENEITKTFSKHFKNFIFGSIIDDCFGYDYHWHIVVCQRR